MVTKEALNEFLSTQFKQSRCTVEEINAERAVIRYRITEADLRPGGTVSGPVMFLVADCALYVAILGRIGIVPLAVTTNMNINFLRKPAADRDIIGECRLIKLGKLLAIGEVLVYSDGQEEPVAHATGTYAIPPKRD
ncbi:PaaI family thioesterase [Limnobacter sp.]|uniref:PaaI family thioesterase n=1 Tax=Limnobacter sp. TaxID=2003368 RepID=UPI0035193E29